MPETLPASSHTTRSTARAVGGLRALVVCRRAGVCSEVWIARQVIGFRELEPELLCWELEEEAPHPLPDAPLHQLSFPAEPMDGPHRWWIRMRNVSSGNYYGSVGAEKRALMALIQQVRPDVILCHFGHVALRLLPVARACGVPLVAHFHGQDISSALYNRWYRTSLLRGLPFFAGVVVVGSHQRRWMLNHGVPPSRVHLIPCGVPTAFFTPDPCERPGNTLRAVAVSRLVPWKGVSESIQAVALARTQGAAVELEVIGTGPQQSELEKLIREQGLGGVVALRGAQSAEEIRARLRCSDVFVQHSLTSATGWQEGFGVSLAEAASMELPVVATRTGGIPDQVLHEVTGLLIPEHDVQGMADALIRLSRDATLRAQLGRAGRERMVRHFDVGSQITKLEAVLVEAARSRRPPRRGLFASPSSTATAPTRLLPLDLQLA